MQFVKLFSLKIWWILSVTIIIFGFKSIVIKSEPSHFDSSICNLYDETDRKKGYIVVKNRQGQISNMPIMTISIVVVSNKNKTFSHPGEISTLASELKDWAKSFQKSVYVTDRRKSGPDTWDTCYHTRWAQIKKR